MQPNSYFLRIISIIFPTTIGINFHFVWRSISLLAFYLASLETDEQVAKFEYIYKKHFNFMWKTAFSITHDSNYAEDAVHEAFLQIIKEIDVLRLENEKELKSYLFLITRERTIDFLRKWDRRKSNQRDTNCITLEVTADSPEHLVFTRLQLEKVVNALSDLPEDYKRPLLLQVKGYSISEIAQIMQCNTSTIKSRIYRARKKILSLFDDNYVF